MQVLGTFNLLDLLFVASFDLCREFVDEGAHDAPDQLHKSMLPTRHILAQHVENCGPAGFEVGPVEVLHLSRFRLIPVEASLESEGHQHLQFREHDVACGALLFLVEVKSTVSKLEQIAFLTAHQRNDPQQSIIRA